MAKKISNSLVTLSSAAILAIYAAGYERTTPAANRFAEVHRRAPTANEAAVVIPAIPTPPPPVKPDREMPGPVRTASASPAVAADTVPNKRAAVETAPEMPPPALKEIAVSEKPSDAPAPTSAAEAPSEPAAAPANAPATTQVASQPAYKDGVFLGWGYSRHGNIQAFVRIEGGHIINAGVQRCETRWPCDLVAHLPPQVIARQSAEVDYVTGATQSGDAFYGAIVAALAQAK